MRENPNLETIYDRATGSAKENRQAVVTMSSASIGVFFITLTTKVDPVLTYSQKWIVIIALVCMAISTFAGLWSAWADARWSYSWGRELENRKQDSEVYQNEKDYWHDVKRKSVSCSLIAFAIGVLSSGIYVILRVFAV